MSNVSDDLRSIGKDFFIKYLDALKDIDSIQNKNIVKAAVQREGYEEASTKIRVSKSRSIIKNKARFREALQIIINSKLSGESIKRARTELANLNPLEHRVCRITWNTNGWICPSGPFGKSKDEESHESKYGYGHEEWLYDKGKIINGFHYAFLEPIRKKQSTYAHRTFRVWLYTIDGISKTRYWIGELKNVEVIDSYEANEVKKIYKKNGWLQEMDSQIIASGANRDGFSEWNGIDLFNIRFKPDEITINYPYYKLPPSHPIYGLSRYAFIYYKDEFKVTVPALKPFSFIVPSDDKDIIDEVFKETVYNREPKLIEISHIHKLISKNLVRYLRNKFGYYRVKPENPVGNGSRVDIVVNDKDNNFIFYEIKTYNFVMTSIREALGQLIEYAFFPVNQNAKELVIVTQRHNEIESIKSYMNHLRNMFHIPIFYQWFDHNTNELSEKY